jgi:hypothetical protein
MKRLTKPFIFCILLALLLAANRPALAQTTRIIFLHHSCGHNLIEEGGVREGLTALGYEFYDHGYNGDGLRLADGFYTGTNYDIPGDNTDPDGLAELFAQPLHDPPDNAFSHLMQYDVIAFKSCFPTSNIYSDEHLAELKSYYLAMRDRMDQYPNKIFIVVTQPPQVPGASDAAEAERARALVNWLASDEFLGDHSNVFTFDFFGYLAGSDDFLRSEYRYDDYDGHPNERANREIGPAFVAFIDQVVHSYEGGGASPAPVEEPTATSAPTGEGEEPAPVVAHPPAAGTVDDFEAGIDAWYVDLGEGAAVTCDLDAESFYGGAASLRMRYDVPSGGWGSCGHSFDSPQDWSGSDGLALWLRSDEAGRWVTLALFAGDPDELTPFEVSFEVEREWTQLTFAWADFAKAEWMGDAGLSALDLTRVASYGIILGEDSRGTLWLDDVVLVTDVESSSSGAAPADSPPDEPSASVEEPAPAQEEGQEPGGGLCTGAAVLPVGLVVVVLTKRRRE